MPTEDPLRSSETKPGWNASEVAEGIVCLFGPSSTAETRRLFLHATDVYRSLKELHRVVTSVALSDVDVNVFARELSTALAYADMITKHVEDGILDSQDTH